MLPMIDIYMKRMMDSRFLLVLVLQLTFSLTVMDGAAQESSAQNWTAEQLFSPEQIAQFGADELMERLNGPCGFFTTTTTTVQPTCNGFSDGEACVLEPTDGIGPYTYQWAGGFPDTDNCLEDIPAGTYTVIVTDVGQGPGAFCPFVIFLNDAEALFVLDMNATASACPGECTGQAIPIVIGGNGGYNYLYDSGENTLVGSMLCNPFQLTVTDSEGCTLDTTFTFVDEPLPINAVGVTVDNDCAGALDGAIDVTVTGGTPDYDYSWTGPGGFTSVNQDISSLEAGQYELVVTDDNGCTDTTLFDIMENTPVSVTASITIVQCAGESTGAIDIELSGGVPDYDFSWSGPGGFTSVDEDISGLIAGDYDLSITDQLGCVTDTSFNVDENDPIDITGIVSSLDCFGDTDGSIDVTVTSVFGGIIYSWSGPGAFTSDQEDISGLSAGTYTLDVTDAGGCTATAEFEVFSPPQITLDALVTDLLCFGDSDGSIEVIVSGGTPDYSYSWTGPGGFTSLDEDIFDLIAGTYTLTVTDDLLCVQDSDFAVSSPAPLVVDTAVTSIQCGGDDTGAIELDISGGTPDYSVSWTGPNGFTSTDEDITGLSAGDYTFIVTDANGCDTSAVVTITEPTPLSLSALVTDLLCFEDGTGSITLEVSGGTPGYFYSWTGPDGYTSSDEDIFGLQAGDYQLNLLDANDCPLDTIFTVNEPDSLELTATVVDITCFGDDDGSIDLEINGGTPDYTVLWTGLGGFSSSDADLTGLVPGTYIALVTDANACSQSIELEVQEPLPIGVLGSVTDILCAGDSTGAIEVTISDGVPDYTYAWTGSAGFSSTDEDIDELIAGAYDLTVTDANGCTSSESFNVDESDPIVLDTLVTDLDCNGIPTGAIDLTLSGGTPDYTYAWTGPDGFTSGDEDISGLLAGLYDLTLLDANFCESTASVQVEQPDTIMVSADALDPSCFGIQDGELDISISGGTPGYGVLWNGPFGFSSTDEDLTGLQEGTYSLTVTDANGCIYQEDFELEEPDQIVLTLDITEPDCDQDNGEVSAVVSGGTVATDYTYLWFDDMGMLIGSSSTIGSLAPGIYSVIVSDDNGCTATQPFTLSDSDGALTAAILDASCAGLLNGSIDLSFTGLVDPVTFDWSGPGGFTATSEDIPAAGAGDYTIIATDDIGCVLVETYTIGEPDPISVSASVLDESCPDDENGSIDITVSGGIPDYVFSWTGPGVFVSDLEDITGLVPGTYSLDLLDDNGCPFQTDVEVDPAETYTFNAVLSEPLCSDSDDGAIDLEVIPPLTGESYSWSGPNGFTASTQDLTDLPPGDYTVIMTTAEFCTVDSTFTITAPDAVIVDVSVTGSACGLSIGSVSLTASGGTVAVDYTYAIFSQPGDVFLTDQDLLSGLDGGLYSYSVADDNGCVATGTFVISDGLGILDAVVQGTTCDGLADGSILIDYSGLLDPVTIAWTGPNGFTSSMEDITSLEAGVYTLSIVDANGCVLGDTYIVESGVGITVNGVATDISCNGDGNGAIDISFSGGTPDFGFLWTGPGGYSSLAEDISGLEAGSYTVVVTDATGCEGTADFIIDEPDAIVVDELITDVLCNGGNTGAIDIAITGGIGPYSTDWDGPDPFTSSFQDISGLVAGTYALTLTDQNACPFIADYEVMEEDPIDILLLELNGANCNQSNGSISVQISGGTPDYDLEWTDEDGFVVATAPLADDLPAGTYDLTVTDANGCITTAQYELTDTEAEISGVVTDLLCNGIPTGAIDVTVTGTVIEPSVTSWIGPDGFTAATDDIADLAAGAYTITITDDASCVFTQDFDIMQPDTIDVTVVTDSLSCEGGSDGAIDIEPTGATPDYSYQWTGPGGLNENTQDISGLLAGDYDLIITDDNDCIYPLQIVVEEPTAISTSAIILDADCASDSTGAIDLSISGGTPDYSVIWSGPDGFSAFTEDINDVPAGDYIAQVTDGNGCPFEETYSVDEPIEISVLVIDSEDSDCDTPTGFIAVQAQDGTPDYDYLWTDDGGAVLSTDTLVEDLPQGIYSLTVTDANGCSFSQDFTISTSDATLEGALTDLTCNGIPTGAIDLTIVGEISDPFVVDWDGPEGYDSDQEDISALPAGDYLVTITDDQNCVFTQSFTLDEPDTLQVDAIQTDVLCFGEMNGALDITASGGVPDYSYSWTGPDGDIGDSEDIENLSAGNYTLQLTDDNACLFEFQAEIVQPDSIIIFGSVSDASCLGLEDGSIDIDPQGGTIDYDYQWTGPDGFIETVEDISSLAPGDYALSLTDANGCVKDTTIILLGNQVIAFSSDVFDVTCNGLDDGSISTTVTGGTPDYSFGWSGPGGFISADADIIDLVGGDYVLLLTDDNGCTLDTTITISEPDTLLLSDLVIGDIECNGDGDGSISLAMGGGTPDLVFSWTGPNAFTADTEDIVDVDGGVYELTVTDANNCQYIESFDIDEPDSLTVMLDNSSDALCENESDGEISITTEGGTPDFVYSWTGPEGFVSDAEDLDGLLPGDYLLLVTDANGCTDDLQAEVGFAIEINADAGSYAGVCNGSEITFDGSASTGLGSYGWSTPGGPTFSTLATATAQASNTNDTFILTITNSTCVDADTLVLDILQLPEPDAGEDAEVFFEDGIVLGGDPTWADAFSFDWSPAAGLDDPTAANPTAVITATTTFVVTVVDLNGCVGADAVIITLDPEVDIYDGFTPNGDDSNELWQIGNREQFPEMEVQIFNRWGDELFQSAPGYPIPWDGTYEGGELPVGTYYYVIELNDPRFPDPITGPVTIFR